MSERDNLRVWAPDRPSCYEVWYLTWNDPRTGCGFWLRFVTEAPDGQPARGELWFARFDPRDPSRTFGVHRRFADVSSGDAPFRVTIGGSELGDDHSFGELTGDGHDIRWDLRWLPGETMRWYPDVMYGGRHGRNPAMVLSPNPRVPLSGSVMVDGEEYSFDRATAGQSHIWASKHSTCWTWAHCTEFVGASDALLEVIAAKKDFGRLATPPLIMVMLDIDGERIRLNQWRHVVQNRGRWRTGHVSLIARTWNVKVTVELSCSPERLLLAPYVDPDGSEVSCANTEIGDAVVTVFKRKGLAWEEHTRLEARGTAHFETGSRERDPAVPRHHVLVT